MAFEMPAAGATWEDRGGWVVRALMRDLGLTIDQAAGLVGNLGGESDGFAAFHEIGKPEGQGGYGWAQWTSDRRVNFFNWCAANKLSPQSDEANYRFLVAELKGDEHNALYKLRNTHTLSDATRVVHLFYERPSDQSTAATAKRLVWAQRALAGAQRQPGGTQEPVPAPSPVQPPEPATTDAGLQAIQLGLRLTGDYDGAIDGRFGALSRAALDAFQSRMRG